MTKTPFRLVEIISYEPCLHSIRCQLDPATNSKTYTFLRSYSKGFKVVTLQICLKHETAKARLAKARKWLLTSGESHTAAARKWLLTSGESHTAAARKWLLTSGESHTVSRYRVSKRGENY